MNRYKDETTAGAKQNNVNKHGFITLRCTKENLDESLLVNFKQESLISVAHSALILMEQRYKHENHKKDFKIDNFEYTCCYSPEKEIFYIAPIGNEFICTTEFNVLYILISAEVAGIVATHQALSCLAKNTKDENIIQMHAALNKFVMQHAEKYIISNLIEN